MAAEKIAALGLAAWHLDDRGVGAGQDQRGDDGRDRRCLFADRFNVEIVHRALNHDEISHSERF